MLCGHISLSTSFLLKEQAFEADEVVRIGPIRVRCATFFKGFRLHHLLFAEFVVRWRPINRKCSRPATSRIPSHKFDRTRVVNTPTLSAFCRSQKPNARPPNCFCSGTCPFISCKKVGQSNFQSMRPVQLPQEFPAVYKDEIRIPYQITPVKFELCKSTFKQGGSYPQ